MEESKQKRKTPITTVSISQEYAKKLDEYLKGHALTRKDFLELSIDYFLRTGFDIRGEAFDLSPLERITDRLESSAKVIEQHNEGTEVVRQLLEAVREQTAKQLPSIHVLKDATDRVAELEHLLGKYQEKIDLYGEEKEALLKDSMSWQQKFHDQEKAYFILLENLQKSERLLEKAKTELKHCSGFFSSADKDILKELGL